MMILHIIWFPTLAPSGQCHMLGMKHILNINITDLIVMIAYGWYRFE